MIESAGTLLYRVKGKNKHVLIVRPTGPAARYGWSIPKGIPDPGESLESAARRETLEEANCEAGELSYLGYADYGKSKKRVHCFVGEAPDCLPKAVSWEVDKAEFVPLDIAKSRLHFDQKIFIDWLEKL